MSKKLFLIATLLFLNVTGLAQNNNVKPAEAAPKRPIGIVSEYTIQPGMMTAYLEWAKKDAQPPSKTWRAIWRFK